MSLALAAGGGEKVRSWRQKSLAGTMVKFMFTKPIVRRHCHQLAIMRTTSYQHHHLLMLLLIVSSLMSILSTCWLSNIIIHQHSVSALTTSTHHDVGYHSIQKTSSFSTSLSAHTTNPPDSDYWANYSLRQSYKKSGGILYKQSILTSAEFSALRDAIDDMLLQDTLKLTDEKSSSFATNRMGAVIEKDSNVYQILSAEDGSLCRLVNCLVEEDEETTDGNNEGEEMGEMILSPDIPIEVRLLLVACCLLLVYSSR